MLQDRTASLWTGLEAALPGRVHWPDSPGYGPAVFAFNVTLHHTPDVAVTASSTADVQEAVRAAIAAGMPVRVIGGGHGEDLVTGGMLISTGQMNSVEVDPAAQTATFGAGTRWTDVIAKAAPHGLAPVTGSSPTVGAVGFLTGGGIGPLVRSHGAGADYWRSATVVTGTGEVVRASAEENADLFWALRGGKHGLGVVTEATVELVPLPSLYAGALIYAEEHIEPVLRFWREWTDTAHPQVTTSIGIANLPPMEFIPEPLRGRRVLMLRFAYPGDPEEGERLADPFRSVAPVYMDGLFPMPLTETARIHNDPHDPLPVWMRGAMVRDANDDFLAEVLKASMPGSPFLMVEVRHIGDGALQRDVPEGSAVGGRTASYSLYMIAANPAQFGQAMAASEAIWSAVDGCLNEESNINFAGYVRDEAELAKCWPAPIRERLAEVRTKYDPQGVFA